MLGEVLALTSAFLWGAVPILIRRGLTYSSTSVAVVWGLIVSLPLLAAVFALHPRPVSQAVAPQAAVWFVLVGLLGPCIGRVFNFIGVARLGAARATPLVNSAPLFTTLLAVVFLHEQITLRIVLGMLSIVAGVGFLTGQQRDMNLRDAVYPLLAAVCYSTNPILAKLGLAISNEPILGACIGMVASALVYIAYFFGSGQSRRLWSMPRAAGWYFGLAGLATTVAIFTMFGALQYLPAAVVAPLSSAAPLFTLVLSQLALHDIERVTRSDVIGTLLIVAGVVVLVG